VSLCFYILEGEAPGPWQDKFGTPVAVKSTKLLDALNLCNQELYPNMHSIIRPTIANVFAARFLFVYIVVSVFSVH